MIYSGADLIRTSTRQAAAVRSFSGEPLTAQAVKAVESAPAVNHNPKEDNGSALLRFARFVRDEKDQRRPPNQSGTGAIRRSANPYIRLQQRAREDSERGQVLDIYI